VTRRDLGTIRAVGKNLWRVEVSAGRDPETGKRVRPTATVHGTKAEANRELARLALENGKGRSLKSAMNLASYIEDVYLPYKAKKRRTRTVEAYASHLRLHVIPYLGHVPLSDLDAQTIDHWLARLQVEKSHLSARTLAHAYTVLHTALKQAVRWDYLNLDPMSATERPQVAERDFLVWDAGQIAQALEAFQGDSLEVLIVLALGCGMRRSECFGLTWENVDLEAGEVRVVQGLHYSPSRGLFLEPPKSKRSHRTISLPSWAIERLVEHRRERGPVIRDGDGFANPNTLSKVFREKCRQFGLTYIPLRDLRHSHATVLIEEGVDVTIVSRRMGHSGTGITDAFYVRPTRKADQGAASALDHLGSPDQPSNVVNLHSKKPAPGI
jgi:integrase